MTATITITQRTVKPTDLQIQVKPGSEFNGKQQKPEIVVMDKVLNQIIPASEFQTIYGENISAGQNAGTVTIQDLPGGNYVLEESTQSFEILPKPVKNPKITLDKDRFFADGKPKMPNVTIIADDIVIDDDQFELVYTNNILAGAAEIHIYSVPDGNYDFGMDCKVEFQIQEAQDFVKPAAPSGEVEPEKVKLSDKEALQQQSQEIQKILQDPTVDEQLKETLKKEHDEQLKPVLEQIQKAENAKMDPIQKTAAIKVDTVEIHDETTLEQEKENLEQARKDFSGNYTPEDIAQIDQQLEQIQEAIEEIKVVKPVAESFDFNKIPLPKDAGDPDTQDRLQKVDDLNGHRRQMVENAVGDNIQKARTAYDDYKIIEGDNQTWKKQKGGSLTVVCNGYFGRFQVNRLVIDEGTLRERELERGEDYTAVEGSTEATLTDSCLRSLRSGSHTLTFHYQDGETEIGRATATMKIQRTSMNPDTADHFRMVLWMILLAGSASGLMIVIVVNGRKKKK